jgi:hypothetical protein
MRGEEGALAGGQPWEAAAALGEMERKETLNCSDTMLRM